MTSEETPAWLRAAFDHAPVGLLVHDRTAIVACNAEAAKVLGGRPGDFEGLSVLDIVSEADRETLQEEPEAPWWGHLVRLDGTPVAARLALAEIAPGGHRVLTVETAGDVAGADSIRAEIMKEEEVRRLKETNAFKTQILNTAAHELNTPLTPLRLQLHLLRSGALGGLSERQSKAVDILDRNVRRLSFLVSDVLDVARLESGQLEVQLRPVRMATVIVDALEAYEETSRQVGVRLSHRGDEDLVVMGDNQRLVQVLYNLVGNALKFTPEGGRVMVETFREGQEAVVSVSDTGAGLTKGQIERLFQPFSRVHDTKRSAIAGTGLGLFITRGIVEAHAGTIVARSDGPGKGSTFSFRIPLAEDQEDNVEPARPVTPKPVDALAQRLRELI